jgi:hypothetical protein
VIGRGASRCGARAADARAGASALLLNGYFQLGEILAIVFGGGADPGGVGCRRQILREIGVEGKVTGSGINNPTPKTGIVPAADPLSYLQPPATGGCLAGGAGIVNGTTPVTLNAGNYCGGISIAGNQNVTLNPGTYTITGGGLTFNGSGTVRTGGNLAEILDGLSRVIRDRFRIYREVKRERRKDD